LPSDDAFAGARLVSPFSCATDARIDPLLDTRADAAKESNMNPVVEQPAQAIDPASAVRPSRAAWWTGWIISAIPILMMGVLGIVMIVFFRKMVDEGNAKYGYPPSVTMPLMIVEIVCVILYAIPATSVLGAVLLTGYLGGAVATHVRAGEPVFSVVFAIVFGVLVWLGLYLRNPTLRLLIPFSFI
jgi:hypothetical protein